MNARFDTTDATPAPARPGRFAVSRSLARIARPALVLLVCGFAQAQNALGDLIAADARKLLHHADPEVRGEAALIAAHGADHDGLQQLLALAKDPAPATRHRALIALGLCGSPVAVRQLESVLADHDARSDDDGIAAAFGLGLVAGEAATSATTRVLSGIAQSSWKRQRDMLLALLLAMTERAPRVESMALRQLFDDESNRDPEVRGLLLTLLLGTDRAPDDKARRKLLVRGSVPERLALLQAIDGAVLANDAEALAAVERQAKADDDGTVRAAALAALTRANHLGALDLALHALRNGRAPEAAQALRTLLAIGGAGMLRAAAPRLVEERDPNRKAAMLRAFDGPPPPALLADVSRLATDGAQPWPLRTAAVLMLARSDAERTAPLLRDTFRATTDTSTLPDLAHALRRAHGEPVALARLFDHPEDLRREMPRWLALLQAEHPEAQREVLAALHVDERDPALLPALRAWRLAAVLDVPRARPEAVPERLRLLLGRGP